MSKQTTIDDVGAAFPLPEKLVAVYGGKSKKSVHIGVPGVPGGSTLLVVRGGEYGDNFDILAEMVSAYNDAQKEQS